MISYIRGMKRYFWLFGLFVILAQESWAFVVSDTLIIDGEIIYIEEQDTPVTDSLSNSRKTDFKEKKKPVVWGIDGAYSMQITDFSISNNVHQDLLNVNEFLGRANPTFYHSGVSFGGYIRVHRNIEIGTAFNYNVGNVSESSAYIANQSNTVSFFSKGNQIQQVFETEVQQEVTELDTLSISPITQSHRMTSIQIPLKLRFYVNEFTVKSRWRAFGEISPVYRSFQMRSRMTDSNQMLFLNQNGSFEYLNVGNQSYRQFGVLVGAGSEFLLTKKLDFFVQANWSFPPVNQNTAAGANYFTQYSSLFLGVRVLVGQGK